MYLAGRQCWKVGETLCTNEYLLGNLESRVILQVCIWPYFLPRPFTQLLFLLYYITALPLTALNLPLGIKNVCVYCTDVRLLSKYNSMAMGLEIGTQLQQCVALNKPLTLPKSWLGPLDMGEWETLISLFPLILSWLTNCSFWPHRDPSRKEGKVTWKKVLTYYCQKMVACPPGLRGVSSWHFLWWVLLWVLWRPALGPLQMWHCQKQRASFIRPHSIPPEGVHSWDLQDNIPAKGSTAGPWNHDPSLTSHQKAGSVVPRVTLDLLAQPHWVA